MHSVMKIYSGTAGIKLTPLLYEATLLQSQLELEQGQFFLHGLNIPSPTAQTVLCVTFHVLGNLPWAWYI